MSPLSDDPYIELYVPDAKTEQEFLRLTVQAAVMKYRQTHGRANSPPQATYDEACRDKEAEAVAETPLWLKR